MAYEAKYYNDFYGLHGAHFELEIKELDYSGGSTLIKLDGETPIKLKYNRKNRIISTGVTINIKNDNADKLLFAKMQGEPYKTYKAVIKKDTAIYFEGFLLPQTYSQNWDAAPSIQLTFSNGLSMLEHTTPSFLTDGTTELFDEMDILINILGYLDLDYEIYVNSSLYEDDMSVGEKAANPLDATVINRNVFVQNTGDSDNAFIILNKILESINADCFIKGEKIYIERFADKITTSKEYWTYQLGSSSGTTGSSDVVVFAEKNLDSIKSLTQSIGYQVDPPLKQIKLKLNLLQFNNLYNNYFDREVTGTSGYYAFRWAHNNLLTFDNTNWSNEFITRGLVIGNPNSPDTEQFRNSNFQTEALCTNPDDGMIFTVKFKHYYRLISGKALDFTFYFSFVSFENATRYYVQTDGSIQAVLTNALHTVTIENDGDDDIYEQEITKTFDLTGIMTGVLSAGEMAVSLMIRPPNIFDIGDVDPLFDQGSGTVTVTNGSKTVVGSGTSFSSDFSVEDKIIVFDGVDEVYVGIIDTITDNTHIELDLAYPGTTYSGKNVWRVVRDPLVSTSANIAAFGDFTLTQDDIKINNLLEADLNNEAFAIKEKEMSLFDSGYVHYHANKLLRLANGYAKTEAWTDVVNTSESLQNHYLLNMCNLYNSSNPIFSMAIQDSAVDVFIDDVFYTALLDDDLGANMKFYVDSLTYDMRQHKYTVSFKKYIRSIGKDIA